MKRPFLGLRTVAYNTWKLQKTKDWYTKVFGIEPYFDEPFYVGFNIGGYELGLTPTEKPELESGDGPTTYWGVEDIHAVYKMMLEAGATPFEEPNNVGGELMVAAVKDPWGNIVGIIYNPYFKLPEA